MSKTTSYYNKHIYVEHENFETEMAFTFNSGKIKATVIIEGKNLDDSKSETEYRLSRVMLTDTFSTASRFAVTYLGVLKGTMTCEKDTDEEVILRIKASGE